MSWPKLSLELTGPKSPVHCQSCGAEGTPEIVPGFVALDRWVEHDANDHPTSTVVVLCPECSKGLIEKHPRLYSRLEANQPYPGAMLLCGPCEHRQGVTCPLAAFNGGPGVVITHERPTSVHLQRVPRRLSGWAKFYPSGPKACDRRTVVESEVGV